MKLSFRRLVAATMALMFVLFALLLCLSDATGDAPFIYTLF